MKDIKTKTIVKNIKRLDRSFLLIDRAKNTAPYTRKQTDNDKVAGSPIEYAQQHSAKVMKTVISTKKGIDVYISKRWIKRLKIKRILKNYETITSRTGGIPQQRNNIHSLSVKPSLRWTRGINLRQSVEGRSIVCSGQEEGKQRFIRSRVNVRLRHHSSDSVTPAEGVKKEITRQEPAEKKAGFVVNKSSFGYIRRTHHLSPTFEQSKQRHLKKLIPSITPRKNANKIKRKGQMLKSISPYIPVKLQRERNENQSDTYAEGKRLAVKTAQRSVQMVTATRRSFQRAQAAAKFQLRMIQMIAKAAALIVKGLAALLGVSSSVIILLCIIMAVAAVISSPFGIFVSDENTEPDVQPLAHIVQELDTEFAGKLEEIQYSVGSVDRIEYHYLGSADNTRMDNWSDIIAVFSIKTVMDSENGMDVATLDATRTDLIRSVFWEMNQVESHIETMEYQETIVVEHEDGSTSEETTSYYERILHITVTSRTSEQQANEYDFTLEQKDLMSEMLSSEFRLLMFALLGKDTDVGLTGEQLQLVTRDLPAGEHGSEAVKLALTRLGDRYSQPKAGQDDYTDCSYLVQWVYRQLNIRLPRTAAEQARHCVENGLIVSSADLVPGDLVFWSYERNDRFMDITHVGIYAGDGKVVDASSGRGQVVYRNLFDADKQVLYGRPQIIDEQ